MLKTVLADNEVQHILTSSVPLGQVEIQIDCDKRHLHTILHSAGHLIGNVGQSLGLSPKSSSLVGRS